MLSHSTAQNEFSWNLMRQIQNVHGDEKNQETPKTILQMKNKAQRLGTVSLKVIMKLQPLRRY